MMKFMSRRHRHFPLAVGLALAACDRSPSRTSVADSVLSRDLTLAAAPTPAPAAPSIGDTATNAPERVSPATTAPPSKGNAAPAPVSTPPAPTAAAPVAPSAPAKTPPPAASTPSLPPSYESILLAQKSAGGDSARSNAAGGGGRPELLFGTMIVGTSSGSVCAKANRPGDRLVLTTSANAYGPNGAVLPTGSKIVIEMTTPEAGAEFSFRAVSVQVDSVLHPIYGTVRTQAATPPIEERTTTNQSKGGLIGNVMTGAILGRILGGNNGALIGAAGGAAAGTIAARRSAVKEHCLPAGVSLSLVLSAPLPLGQGTP